MLRPLKFSEIQNNLPMTIREKWSDNIFSIIACVQTSVLDDFIVTIGGGRRFTIKELSEGFEPFREGCLLIEGDE